MEDSYDYHLTYKNDGIITHYYVERNNTTVDGKIDLTYTTSSNTLDVEAKNIKVLHIDCISMFNDESKKVFKIDPYEYPNYYRQYFIERNLFKVKVDTETNYTNLTFKYTPIPVKVIVNGQEWWKAGINYSYNGEDMVFTQVPQGKSEIEVYFREDFGLVPPIAAFTFEYLDNNTVRFNASASCDPNGDIETYLWDFGDSVHPFGTGMVVVHDYTMDANYTVVLTVRDSDKLKDSAFRIVPIGMDVTPWFLKNMAIADLEAARSGDWCIDKELDWVIKNINKSLYENWWLNETHLDSKNGSKVFIQELVAVAKMKVLIGLNCIVMKILQKKISCYEKKNKDTTDLWAQYRALKTANAAYESALDRLIKADQMLAGTIIQDAMNTTVKNSKNQKHFDHWIDKAKDQINEAENDLAKDKHIQAISHYRLAWKYAQKAIDWANKA
jgi:PKD repeat protein